MPIAQCSRSRVSSLIYALLIALLLTGLVALLLRNVYIESNKASLHRQLGTFAWIVCCYDWQAPAISVGMRHSSSSVMP